MAPLNNIFHPFLEVNVRGFHARGFHHLLSSDELENYVSSLSEIFGNSSPFSLSVADYPEVNLGVFSSYGEAFFSFLRWIVDKPRFGEVCSVQISFDSFYVTIFDKTNHFSEFVASVVR